MCTLVFVFNLLHVHVHSQHNRGWTFICYMYMYVHLTYTMMILFSKQQKDLIHMFIQNVKSQVLNLDFKCHLYYFVAISICDVLHVLFNTFLLQRRAHWKWLLNLFFPHSNIPVPTGSRRLEIERPPTRSGNNKDDGGPSGWLAWISTLCFTLYILDSVAMFGCTYTQCSLRVICCI